MITAISALAARWSSRSFGSQPSLQFFVRFDSQRIVPQIWSSGPMTRCSTSPPNSPLGTGWIVSRGNLAVSSAFELQFLNFSLKLLRALFGAPFQFFDLPLHGGDGLVFLHDFELQFFFGFFFGFVPLGCRIGLHALFDGQVHFALGVVQLALLADHFGLSLLGFGEFCIALFQDFLQIVDFFNFLIEIIAEREFGFLCSSAAMRARSCWIFAATCWSMSRFCFFEGLRAFVERLLLALPCRCLFARGVVRNCAAYVGEQRRRERLREFDFGSCTADKRLWVRPWKCFPFSNISNR